MSDWSWTQGPGARPPFGSIDRLGSSRYTSVSECALVSHLTMLILRSRGPYVVQLLKYACVVHLCTEVYISRPLLNSVMVIYPLTKFCSHPLRGATFILFISSVRSFALYLLHCLKAKIAHSATYSFQKLVYSRNSFQTALLHTYPNLPHNKTPKS